MLLPLLALVAPAGPPMVLPVACDVRFSGGSGHVVNQPLPAAPHTLSLFLKARHSPEPQVVFGLLHEEGAAENEDYAVVLLPSGELAVKLGKAPFTEHFETSGVDVADGEWHFLALQLLPDVVVVTVDGLEAQRFVAENPRWTSAPPGAQPDDGADEPSPTRSGQLLLGHRMEGEISEVLLWSPPLCPRQIERLRAAAVDRELCSAEGRADAFTVPSTPRAPVSAALPAQLLRCLQAVTVGIGVQSSAADGTVTTLSASKTVISEELFVGGAHGGLPADCESVLRGANALAGAAERAFSPGGFAGLAADAALPASRPHTHLFTLAQSDPALLDDATQVLVMGIMAGMVASVVSIFFGLAVGCWAGASLVKAKVRPLKLV